MPWKECHVVDERLRFIARLLDGEKNGSPGSPGFADVRHVLHVPSLPTAGLGLKPTSAGRGA